MIRFVRIEKDRGGRPDFHSADLVEKKCLDAAFPVQGVDVDFVEDLADKGPDSSRGVLEKIWGGG